MLLTMHIKNIALIEEIDIDFHDQLNILTGETGAGKSIIIGSLGICLGGKFPKELGFARFDRLRERANLHFWRRGDRDRPHPSTLSRMSTTTR